VRADAGVGLEVVSLELQRAEFLGGDLLADRVAAAIEARA
jgi:hypothetical protein